MTRLAKPLDQIRRHYDVVIVGSGYGGGVSASRLARAGKRVAGLERGREFVTGEFPSLFPDMRNVTQFHRFSPVSYLFLTTPRYSPYRSMRSWESARPPEKKVGRGSDSQGRMDLHAMVTDFD